MDINVYLQNNDYVKQLEAERDSALLQAAELKEAFKKLESRVADEQFINLELIDTLRANGLRYRPQCDIRTWQK